jgi:hypothetical protein
MNEDFVIALFIEMVVFVFIWLKAVTHMIQESARIVKERFLSVSERPFCLPTKRQGIALLVVLAIMGVTHLLYYVATKSSTAASP